MKKIAIYVEGQTEAIFVVELIKFLASPRTVEIEELSGFGGSSKLPRQFIEVSDETVGPGGETTHYILVTNSSSDSRVVTDIRDNYENLKSKGFEKIIGLQDVRPKRVDQTERLRSGIASVLADKDDIGIRLAVIETEAWFLAENTHFLRLHSDLTNARVMEILDYLPAPQSSHEIQTPAEDLKKLYSAVGMTYEKSKSDVQRAVSMLSFEELSTNCSAHIDDLKELRNDLQGFFED
ncbi:hypothetical protein [Ruegeria sp. Ofav3-42]|uniref:hypothetical protein n=1 Tax=Ruegeria sp. Ofav3-42 TaxID=2917759 RepID=UPI001EF64AA5|nr:hypothetical protein [Ruegeria sp. Ofav3-42]MCG7519747.1 hypothetical protein [Ruegeria sp. Ofav3-42]